MIGIYKITNIINNKCYVGSSVNIIGRWNQHKKDLKSNMHHSIKLQRSYNKHGINNFKYEVIEECEKELLLIREQYHIDLLNCFNKGYNIAIPSNCVMLGRNHSEKTKKILREKSKGNKNMLGKKHTEETKNKIKEKLKGIELSEETRLKMSISQKNRIYSDEELKKMKESGKSRIGLKMSDESKLKMRLQKLGKKQKPETISNRVKKNTGKKRTEESKKKISDKLKGIIRGPMSEERKLKQSKKIALISINGTIIQEYNSIKMCCDSLNIDHRRLNEVLRGVRNNYKNLSFKYI